MISPLGYFGHSQTSRVRTVMLVLIALVICAAAPAAYAQTYTKLYDFGTNPDDPRNPYWAGVFAQGRDGNLYSTTQAGGIGYGTVFQLTPAGEVKVLYEFPASGVPQGGLTLGTDGYLYGTTLGLGLYSNGSVFKIATDGTGYKTLYSFQPGVSGYGPHTAPIQGIDGNFYGTTAYGHITGTTGSVYKMTPAGVLKTLHEFTKSDGFYPTALMQGTDGNFYGTTESGGILNGAPSISGVIFKMTAAGKLTVLHYFTGADGQNPYGPIIQASDGNFYGTTRVGGSIGYGVVYKITPAGAYTVLHNFTAFGAGSDPFAGLVQATNGKFYGATTGPVNVLYEITSAGIYTVLYTPPSSGTEGQGPYVSLFQHTNGILYGDTDAGGTGSLCKCGVAYKLDMGLGPFVSVLPLASKAAKTVGFLGQGFTGTTKVSFSGAAATFKVVSDTYLTAVVPSGAQTGSITVTTPGGVLTSNKIFKVLPTITSFTPISGPVGTKVTITGSGFIGATKVTFGGVKATSYTVDSGTQITATVPTGAKTGSIAVTTPGGSASKGTFTVS